MGEVNSTDGKVSVGWNMRSEKDRGLGILLSSSFIIHDKQMEVLQNTSLYHNLHLQVYTILL